MGRQEESGDTPLDSQNQARIHVNSDEELQHGSPSKEHLIRSIDRRSNKKGPLNFPTK